MAAKVDKNGMVQSTVRLKKKKLREIQNYLKAEDTNLTKFIDQKVDEFIQDYRKRHPELVRGIDVAHQT